MRLVLTQTINSTTENDKFVVKVCLMNAKNYGDDILLIKPEKLAM